MWRRGVTSGAVRDALISRSIRRWQQDGVAVGRRGIVVAAGPPLYRSSAPGAFRRTRRNARALLSTTSIQEGKEGEVGPSIASIYNPPPYSIPASDQVVNSIRCSVVGAPTSQKENSRDTAMSLVFLGTSAGLPTKNRGPTSTLLRLGGESMLVDAGEGVQRQLMFTRAKPSHIDRIFITHLHGDHLFGLPGLLLGLQHTHQLQAASTMKKKTKSDALQDRVIKIYGPPGLYNFVAANILLSCTLIHSLNIEIHELVGGRVRRTHGSRDMRNPFEADYPEFHFGRLTRHILPCGPDGIWTIEDLPQVTTREAVMSAKKRHMGSSAKGRFRILAAEVDHLSGVVTFGYSIQEPEPPCNIDAAKAKALGVSPAKGSKFDLLKAGFSVWSDDGSQEVHPSQVLLERRRKARKITFVGDNRRWTPSMKTIAQDSDVLVHEATLMEKDSEEWQRRGHSTAYMAGKMSGEVNAQLLVLNHISPKADFLGDDDMSAQLSLIESAKEASNKVSEAIVAYDFMEIVVPWLGFGATPADRGDEEEEETPRKHPQLGPKEGRSIDTKQLLSEWFGPKR